MANQGVNTGRRRFLTASTAVVGAVGVGFAAVPFISSWKPSARAQTAGAPVEVDISKIELEPGMRMIVQWRGQPVWIFKRTPEQLAALPTLNDQLRDPDSENADQTPDFAKNETRALKPEIAVLVVWNEIRGHRDIEFRGRRIADSVQRQAITILVLSAAVVGLAILLILPLTPLPLEKVLFEVISAFGTVGLSTGITADLVPGAQAIIIALMFIGRVGVVTLAVALATNQMRRNYRYPEEKPIVG